MIPTLPPPKCQSGGSVERLFLALPCKWVTIGRYTEGMDCIRGLKRGRQFRAQFIRLLLAITVVGLCTGSALSAARMPDGSQCVPAFPLKAPWLGADAAYSIPLPDGRSVWIFGDTLYGDKRVVNGKDPRIVRNSIGISSCTNGKWNLEYVIRHNGEGAWQDFFQAQHKDTWYWALDGFVHGDDLWVTLLCIRKASSPKPDAFDFETCGADLAKVSGLNGDPQKWKVEYFPMVNDGVAAYPSATTVVSGDYVYLFALYEKGNRPMLLTRIPLGGLSDPARNMQYYSKSGAWKPGFTPADSMAVMEPGATEMTVRYHPELKKWLAVFKSPDLSTDQVLARTAAQISGPWSQGKVIYHVPEMKRGSPGFSKDTFCYAGKEHPEFRTPESILFTYVCNTADVPSIATNSDIYFPKVVRVPLLELMNP